MNKYFVMKFLHELFIKKLSFEQIQEKHTLSDDQMIKIYEQLQNVVDNMKDSK